MFVSILDHSWTAVSPGRQFKDKAKCEQEKVERGVNSADCRPRVCSRASAFIRKLQSVSVALCISLLYDRACKEKYGRGGGMEVYRWGVRALAVGEKNDDDDNDDDDDEEEEDDIKHCRPRDDLHPVGHTK